MLQQQLSTDSKARILVHPPDGLPHQVVATYLDNCRKGLQSLKDAIERLDYGHRMKGCGAAFGFPELTETGAAIEQAARIRNDADLQSCAVALEAHLESFEIAEA